MKVVYICPGLYSPADGILQKVLKKTKFWDSQGFSTRVITYNDIELKSWQKTILKVPHSFTRSFFYFLIFTATVNRICREVEPDLIYTRHFIFPFFVYRKCKIVLEVNNDILAENKKQEFKMRKLIEKSVAYYNKYAAAIVNVGEKLGMAFDSVEKKILIPNSILATSNEVLDNFKDRAAKIDEINRKNIICFMATKNRPYYAIDFIVEFVAKLKQPHELWIIGDIKPKTIKNRSKANIRFLGAVNGEALKEVLLESKLAIGLIDFHKGATASPLKTRTYIEFGLPVFCTDNDCDFDNSLPFYHTVKVTDNKSADQYAAELEKFLESDAVKKPTPMATLPEPVKMACLDYREMKVVDFLRRL